MARRAAIYLRVSKDELRIANQRSDVERVIRSRSLALVKTYDETGSAAKARPVFDAMMGDARRGAFEVLVVWALDRFGRSMAGNLQAVLALDATGVQLVSVREPWLDTSGPVRPLLVAIFSWVAEHERSRLIERTNAGLARARAEGVHLGRPPKPIDVKEADELLEAGLSLRQVAKRLHVAPMTLGGALKRTKRALGEGAHPLSRTPVRVSSDSRGAP
jgi:putative DNA-invertase from lambdoid prophage Rac